MKATGAQTLGQAPHVPYADGTSQTRSTFAFEGWALGEVADAVVALDSQLRVVAWNSAAEQLYGLRASEVLHKPLGSTISCRPRSATRLKLRPALDAIGLVDGPATHVLRSGRQIPVRVSLLPFRDSSDTPLYLALVQDDGGSREMEASLEGRVSFEMLLAELSACFSGLLEDKIDGEIETWLRRLVDMLDADRSAFSLMTPDGLRVTHAYAAPGIQPCPPGIADGDFPWLTRELKAGRTVVLGRIPDDLPDEAVAERLRFAGEGMLSGIGIPVSVGGNLVCVLTFGTFRETRAWSNEAVSQLRLVGEVFANAVSRRQAKQRLEQQQSELAHVARVASMGELASVIAHELNQPLTAVVSNAQAVRYLLQAPEPDLSEADEALKDVIDSGMRASEIVHRERHLLRKSQLSVGPIDVNECVREIELFIRAEARQQAASVVLELLPGLAAASGDRIQLQQVVLNLARNALQAMTNQPRERRELRISTAAEHGEVRLSVRDTGPEVTDLVLQRMFEPFFTTKSEGLGMGLAICKTILDGHRGRIWAERGAAAGLVVQVALPQTRQSYVDVHHDGGAGGNADYRD